MNEHIKEIAAREGISTQEVYEEIQKAIEYAWSNSDRKAKRAQIGLTGKLKPPTPEELIAAIVERTQRELGY